VIVCAVKQAGRLEETIGSFIEGSMDVIAMYVSVRRTVVASESS
jgi:hypothetical protein